MPAPGLTLTKMEIDMNTDRLNPEQALTIARANAEGCTLTNVAPPAAAPGGSGARKTDLLSAFCEKFVWRTRLNTCT